MAELNVLTYPDPFLTTIAKPVEDFGESMKEFCQDMVDTMYKNKGLGLAAVQVGEGKRIFVMDINYNDEIPIESRTPLILVNPVIVQSEGEQSIEEGCLSVVDFRAEIKRAAKIVVRYQNPDQGVQELEAEGLQAVCIQHEIDHLDGKIFVDRLPPLKRKIIQKKLRKQAIEAQ